jgi:hypothetical protein
VRSNGRSRAQESQVLRACRRRDAECEPSSDRTRRRSAGRHRPGVLELESDIDHLRRTKTGPVRGTDPCPSHGPHRGLDHYGIYIQAKYLEKGEGSHDAAEHLIAEHDVVIEDSAIHDNGIAFCGHALVGGDGVVLVDAAQFIPYGLASPTDLNDPSMFPPPIARWPKPSSLRIQNR